MKKYIYLIIILVFVCGNLFSQKSYDIPLGSENGSIELKLKGLESHKKNDIRVQVIEYPEWLVFYQYEFEPKKNGKVDINFELYETAKKGKDGKIILEVVDSNYVYATKEIDVKIIEPKKIKPLSNYPNPFNPTTVINYQLPETSIVTLKVYDILGKEINTLLNKEEISPGDYRIEWNGEGLASGVYITQLITETRSGKKEIFKQKMILLK